TFAQKAVAVSGSAATVLARTGRTEIVGSARWVVRSKSPRNNPWPAAIPRFSLWALAPLVSPRVGGSWTRILIASWWRHGRGSADGRGRCAETRNFQSISGVAGCTRPTAIPGEELPRHRAAPSPT